MSGRGDKVTETDLHAYLDGELDPEQRREVERHLAEFRDDAGRLESYRAQADRIRRVYGPLIERPSPAKLTAAVAGLATPRQRRIRRESWRALAASILLLLVGGGAGWLCRDLLDSRAARARTFVDEAVAAHLVFTAEVRHPVEVHGSDYGHLVGWLSKRVGANIKAPLLESIGYQLIGGRLLPGGGRPAAQFMYEDKGGRRVTLYVRTTDGAPSAFRLLSEGPVSALYWREEGLAWALMAEMDQELLMKLAHTIYSALNS